MRLCERAERRKVGKEEAKTATKLTGVGESGGCQTNDWKTRGTVSAWEDSQRN